MEESIAETCLHLEPARKPVDWHCREEPAKTLSERSIEGLEEELTVDEEKELVRSTAYTLQHCLHTTALPTHCSTALHTTALHTTVLLHTTALHTTALHTTALHYTL